MADSDITYTSNLPPWHATAWENLYNRANDLSQQPFPQYTDPRIAGFSADQLNAMQMARAGVGQAQPILGSAVNAAQGAMQGPTTAGISQFMNPYNDLVTNNVLNELQRRNDVAAQGDAAGAVKAGAFGGDRYGIVQSERQRNLDQTMADVLSQRGEAAYASGLDQFNKQQAMGLQGAGVLSNLAGNTQALNSQDVSSLLGIGTLQQGQEQQGLDINYNDFQKQAQYPFDQVNFVKQILQGTPSSQTTQTSTPSSQSSASQWIGLGLAGVGTLGKAFGWF